MPQRQGAHLLRQVDGVASDDGTEGFSTADENARTARAVAGIAGALLLINFLLGAIDFRAALGLVVARLPFRQLPLHHAVQDIGARLQPENVIGQIDGSSFFRFECLNVGFHDVTFAPSSRAASGAAGAAASAPCGSRKAPGFGASLGRERLTASFS